MFGVSCLKKSVREKSLAILIIWEPKEKHEERENERERETHTHHKQRDSEMKRQAKTDLRRQTVAKDGYYRVEDILINDETKNMRERKRKKL